jgi:hypothetical protein
MKQWYADTKLMIIHVCIEWWKEYENHSILQGI